MTDPVLRPAIAEDAHLLRQLADTYWDGLMPTAPNVSSPEARSSYFISRFGDGTSQTYLAEVEGTAITGTYDGAFGEHEVTGIVDGSSVEFGFDQPEWGRFMFHGVIEGNSMEGTCEYGALGPGDFIGSREEEPAGDWA